MTEALTIMTGLQNLASTIMRRMSPIAALNCDCGHPRFAVQSPMGESRAAGHPDVGQHGERTSGPPSASAAGPSVARVGPLHWGTTP
jgi:hypothetical protein